MLNKNPSARTAAQQSTKSSLLFRQAQFLAILMLAAGLLSLPSYWIFSLS